MAARRRLCAGALGLALAVWPVVVSTGASGQTAPPPIDLTVMTFNIWYGATVTDGLDEVVRAIREADADVVGLQEPYARIRRIAKGLGFHASPRMHVVSRYPILEPAESNGDWAYLLLAPGEVAAIANTHLTCCPYTPYRIVNRGFDRPEAMAQERRTRLDQIRDHLSALEPLLSAGVPTFFTGDFNAPSHRDWTAAAVRARGLPYTMRWPVSLAMEGAGFRDSYRKVYPDPVADPGFTWTAGYPAPYVYPNGRCSTGSTSSGPRVRSRRPGARSSASRAPTRSSRSAPGPPTTGPSPRRLPSRRPRCRSRWWPKARAPASACRFALGSTPMEPATT